MPRREYHREVAGQVRLRRQRIHLLGTRRARHHLHGNCHHAALRHLLDQRLVVERVEEADVDGNLRE